MYRANALSNLESLRNIKKVDSLDFTVIVILDALIISNIYVVARYVFLGLKHHLSSIPICI